MPGLREVDFVLGPRRAQPNELFSRNNFVVDDTTIAELHTAHNMVDQLKESGSEGFKEGLKPVHYKGNDKRWRKSHKRATGTETNLD